MVTYKKLVSVYLPEELYQALISYQEQQKFEEASGAVAEILAQFFHKGNKAKRYATLEQVEALEGKVTRLSQQVVQLNHVITNFAITEAARTTSTIGNEFAQLANLVPASSVSFGSASFEEEEDEPDEVLYDFLEPERPSSPKDER